MHIRERDLRGVDLNLLVTLLVLVRERSVSKAAARLHLGQPAVSGALARLRELFDDALLVRGPDGMRPTARALELQERLLPAMADVQSAVLDASGFDPATSDRRFTVAMMDWVDAWLLPRLLARVMAEAPGVRLSIVSTDRFRYADQLLREQADLVVGPFPGGPAWQHTVPLASVPYRCIARPGVIGKGRLALARFVELPHLMVTYRGAPRGLVDEALDAQGLSRRIVCTLPGFASLPAALRELPAVATVPQVLADAWVRDHGLVQAPVPVPLPANQVVIAFHRSRERDPALRWLRALVEGVAKARPKR